MGELVDVGMNKLEMASYQKYINSLNIYIASRVTQSNASPIFDTEYLDPLYKHYIIVMLIISNTF